MRVFEFTWGPIRAGRRNIDREIERTELRGTLEVHGTAVAPEMPCCGGFEVIYRRAGTRRSPLQGPILDGALYTSSCTSPLFDSSQLSPPLANL